MLCLFPGGTSTTKSLHLGLREPCWRGRVKITRTKWLEWQLWEWLIERHDREAAPMKSQQYSCQNKTYTMTVSVDMSSEKGKVHKALPLAEKQRSITAKRGRISIFAAINPWNSSNPRS